MPVTMRDELRGLAARAFAQDLPAQVQKQKAAPATSFGRNKAPIARPLTLDAVRDRGRFQPVCDQIWQKPAA